MAANYVDGVPLHIARPNDSIFCIMPEAEYLQKSPREVQEILRTQNIVITDRSESSLEFDKKGLRSLCQNLSNSVTIQGLPYYTSPFIISKSFPKINLSPSLMIRTPAYVRARWIRSMQPLKCRRVRS